MIPTKVFSLKTSDSLWDKRKKTLNMKFAKLRALRFHHDGGTFLNHIHQVTSREGRVLPLSTIENK